MKTNKLLHSILIATAMIASSGVQANTAPAAGTNSANTQSTNNGTKVAGTDATVQQPAGTSIGVKTSSGGHDSKGLGSTTISGSVSTSGGMCTNIPKAITFNTCGAQGMKDEFTEADAQKAGLLHSLGLGGCDIAFSFPGLPDFAGGFSGNLPDINLCNAMKDVVAKATGDISAKIEDTLNEELMNLDVGNEYIGVSADANVKSTTQTGTVSLTNQANSTGKPKVTTPKSGAGSSSRFSNLYQ